MSKIKTATMQLEKEYQWKIERVVQETPDTRSHYLRTLSERPDFIAGQYLTIKLPDVVPSEGKAYSIASAPHEELYRITVKTMGKFSTAINSLHEGDTVITSAPYGFFYPEPDDQTPLVLVIGGIGITPAISIINDLVHKGDARPVHLLYSNQTTESTVFGGELAELASRHQPLSVTHFITRETPARPDQVAGRLTASRILATTTNLSEPEFFLCGSIKFVRELYQDLKAYQIPANRLYTEGFF
jgi:nitric oxide dioxygenase